MRITNELKKKIVSTPNLYVSQIQKLLLTAFENQHDSTLHIFFSEKIIDAVAKFVADCLIQWLKVLRQRSLFLFM